LAEKTPKKFMDSVYKQPIEQVELSDDNGDSQSPRRRKSKKIITRIHYKRLNLED